MAQDFIIVNKTKSELQVRQEYRPLPCLAGNSAFVTTAYPDVALQEGAECTLYDTRGYDEHYERFLVITKEDGAEVFTLTESLVGLPNQEKLCVYPVDSPPHIETTFASWFKLQLVLSTAGGCAEALQVLLEEDASLLTVTNHLQAIVKALAIPDAAAGAVVGILNDTGLLPPVLSPVTTILAKPSALLSPTGLPSLLPKPKLPSVTKFLPPVHLSMPCFTEKKKPIHTHSEIPIRVRNGPEDGMNAQEHLARQARLSVIADQLGPKFPRIGLSTSGGGMRAMIGSCGFFAALKELGVMDIALYQCGLSGSTWSTSKWMINSANPFVTYKNVAAADCWSSDVKPQPFDQVDISQLLHIAGIDVLNWEHFQTYIPLLITSRSLLKVYSILLATKMEATGADYSIFQSKTLTGKFPIPLLTAAFNDHNNELKFADYSPFEIGSLFTKTFFPFGYFQVENFKAPLPPTINEMMAVWGSAFYARVAQIIPDMPSDFQKLLGNLTFLPGAKVVNASYNRLDDVTKQPLPLANYKYLYYKDGGIQANTPIEPLVRPERTVNMLIVFNVDASVSTEPFSELLKAIPEIKAAIPTSTPTFPYVFPSTPYYPTIVYIPLLKNAAFDPNFDPIKDCGTLKFHYTKDEATKLFGLSHYLTMQAKDAIWNVINSMKGKQ